MEQNDIENIEKLRKAMTKAVADYIGINNGVLGKMLSGKETNTTTFILG